MQSAIGKLYPHRRLAETARCLLAAELYNFEVELSNDFNFVPEHDVFREFLSTKKPLLIYEKKQVCTSKAICFFFHRLKNEDNDEYADILNSHLSWVQWSESFEECIELLSRKKIVDCLDELDLHLKKNKERNISFLNGETNCDEFSLADIFVYVALKHCEIQVCENSWVFISDYLKRIHGLKSVQDVLSKVEKIYKHKPVYTLFVSKEGEKDVNEHVKKETYYVTTAINYVNGSPHVGHAYEMVLADVFARYNRNLGRKTYFTTGADEHGIKIANQAKENNMTPTELCNKYVEMFQELNVLMNTSEDYYVRTTNEAHKSAVQTIWNELEKKGDIYLGEYEGWYNVREETYVPENEAKLTNYMDPLANVKLEKMKEPSYFFKMSKYQDQLIEHIKNNPEYILPEQKKNEILQRLKEPLMDLSCSRTTFTWGISVPSDTNHVMYVWMDALLTYYTSCFANTENGDKTKFWPAYAHVIGKDILWFHAVIFTTILMACNFELPKHIYAHGFVLSADGKKMSKSLGNIVDPFDIIKDYTSDGFRYHVIKETKLGSDVRFDVDNLVDMCNSDLADILGNLVHRILALCASTNSSKIPPYCEALKDTLRVPFNALHFVNRMECYIKEFQIQKCCEKTMDVCKALNRYLTDLEPWKLKENEKDKKLHIIRIMLESIYFLAHYLDLFIPTIASNIFKRLNAPQKHIIDLSVWLDNLHEGEEVNNEEGVLFKKFDVVAASIKMQKVVMKVCKIIEILNLKESAKYTVCTIEVDNGENVSALLNLPPDENHVNVLTLALTNMKPISINNVVVSAVIPHVGDSIFMFPQEDESYRIGTFINAKDYPLLAKKRDKLTQKEITALDISIIQNCCFFNKVIPLISSTTGKPLCHASVPKGFLKFF